MTAVTSEFARQIVGDLRPLQRSYRSRFGTTFVFLADEFYLRAGINLPGRAHYGAYPQIEDGVGMVRGFVVAAERTLRRNLVAELRVERGALHGTVATGELFYPILNSFVNRFNEQAGTRLKVVAVKNRFFGEEVTVAGLIGGGDLMAAREAFEGDFLIVPEQACLKSGHIFLDDMTLEDLSRELQIPVAHGGASLASLIERARAL
jgi:NifB/MoaA-like Fe-S oxidoreductase